MTHNPNPLRSPVPGIKPIIGWLALALLITAPRPAEAESFRVAGLTAPKYDAILSAVVPGKIQSIAVKEGEAVKKGQLLIQLNNSAEKIQAELGKLISESQIEVTTARKSLEMLESDLASTQQLFDRTGSVSKELLDQKILEAEIGAAQVEALELTEQREKLEYDLALVNLKRREIRATVDGVVSKLFLEIGESCEPRQPLTRLVNTSEVDFNCSMDAKLAATLKLGQEVRVQIDTGTESLEVTGVITFISPIVDAASGLREIRATFANPEGRVAPGVAGILLLDQ